MEEMSLEGNTNLESSPPTMSHVSAGQRETNVDISPEPTLDNSLRQERVGGNKVDGKLDNCSIVNSDDAGESDTNMDIPSAQSLDNSLNHENDASDEIDCTLASNTSKLTGSEGEKAYSYVESDEPTMHHVEVPTLLRHKRTYSAEPSQLRLKSAAVAHKRTYSSEHVIDTAAPIESVKEAVSKFGGIVDWKAHKMRTEQKRKTMEIELEKVQGEMLRYKEQSEAAKDEKDKVLSELDSKTGVIKDLKLDLERAINEEQQAKQDAELAKLRVKEVQQGIGNGVSAAIHAELEVAQARLSAAVAELKSVKDKLEKLSSEYSALLLEKDVAVRRAAEAALASMEVEKTVEMLTLELNTVKGSLESAHAAHLEAEEERLREDISKIQESSSWEKELKEAEEELKLLEQEHQSEQGIKLKLEEATALLLNLKAELEAYKEGISKKNQEDIDQSPPCEELDSPKRELEELRAKIEKAMTDMNYLKVASASLSSELEKEKLAVSFIKTREGMAAVTVSSLEADLSMVMSELELIHSDVPTKLSKATQEMERSKSLALSANAEMTKAKEEGELLKAIAFTIERKLCAAQLEIEAARASERFTLAAVKSLEESELVGSNGDENAQAGVTLSLEEYKALSNKAYNLEEQARDKLAAVIAQVEEAKKSELRSLERLEEVNRQKMAKNEELQIAIDKAEKAKEHKLNVEQQLRKWRTENEQRRRSSDVGVGASDFIRSRTNSMDERKLFEPRSMEDSKRFERSSTAPVQADVEELMKAMESDSSSETEVLKKKKKKKSLFPRIVMFLARRKVQASKAI